MGSDIDQETPCFWAHFKELEIYSKLALQAVFAELELFIDLPISFLKPVSVHSSLITYQVPNFELLFGSVLQIHSLI